MALSDYGDSGFEIRKAIAFAADLQKVIARKVDGSVVFAHRPDLASVIESLSWNLDGSITIATAGLILISPNGTKYKLSVLDNGALVTTPA